MVLTLFLSAGLTVPFCPSRLFRLAVFFVKMWLLLAFL